MSTTTTGQEPKAGTGQEPNAHVTDDQGSVRDTSVAPSPEDQESPEEPFDKERALATIRKLRESEKLAKQYARELEALRARVKQYEDAKLSETERLQKVASESERRAILAEQRIAQTEIRADFVEKAIAAGVADIRLAYLAAQADGLLGNYDPESGTVSKHDFAELKKRYPHLFRPSTTPSADAGAGNPVRTSGMNEWIRRAAGRS